TTDGQGWTQIIGFRSQVFLRGVSVHWGVTPGKVTGKRHSPRSVCVHLCHYPSKFAQPAKISGAPAHRLFCHWLFAIFGCPGAALGPSVVALNCHRCDAGGGELAANWLALQGSLVVESTKSRQADASGPVRHAGRRPRSRQPAKLFSPGLQGADNMIILDIPK